MASYKLRQNEVDNALFEKLRKEVVDRGYLPDFAALGNSAAYDAAKQTIKAGGKQIIEVFSTGSAKSKGEENVNNIVIRRGTPVPAKTGVGISYEYDYDSGTELYNKAQTADSKFDITYRISYFANTAEYADIIEDVIRACFGIRMYLDAYDDNGNITGQFWVRYSGEADTSMPGYIERMVQYESVNIDLIGDKPMGTAAPMQEITVGGQFIQEETTEEQAVEQANEPSDFSIDIEIESENDNP